MEIKAKLNNLRIAPRKTGLVAGMIRNMPVKKAENILRFAEKRPSDPLLKLLKSAIYNAKNNFNLKEDDLKIKEIKVDKGPTLKRFMPRARGRASRINKRTSHITMILSDTKNQEKAKKLKK